MSTNVEVAFAKGEFAGVILDKPSGEYGYIFILKLDLKYLNLFRIL
jgi:hypothetical protein